MKKLWFKRRIFGWGWYPSSWEGWVTTLVHVALVILFATNIDDSSPIREVLLQFILPTALVTVVFIWIAYKTGEKPRFQWGRKRGE